MQILGPFCFVQHTKLMAFFRGNIFPNLIPLLFQAKKMSVTGTKDAQPQLPVKDSDNDDILGVKPNKEEVRDSSSKKKNCFVFFLRSLH